MPRIGHHRTLDGDLEHHRADEVVDLNLHTADKISDAHRRADGDGIDLIPSS